MAQTPERPVRHSASTSTKPRSSSFRPTASPFRPVVFGTLPIETMSFSQASSWFAPLASTYEMTTPFLPDSTFADLDAELDVEALLREDLLCLGRNLLVDGAEKRRQRFEHGHLRAEAAPDRPHLESDHAGADHAERLGHRWNAQSAVVRQHRRLVERGAGQRARARTRRDDDLLAGQRLRLRAGDVDLVAALDRLRERAASVEERDLVLLEEIEDAVVVLLDDGVLATQHLLDVDAEIRQPDAVIREVMAGLVEILG